MIRESQDAWDEIARTLTKVLGGNEWLEYPGTGIECAVRAIETLAARPKVSYIDRRKNILHRRALGGSGDRRRGM